MKVLLSLLFFLLILLVLMVGTLLSRLLLAPILLCIREIVHRNPGGKTDKTDPIVENNFTPGSES